MGTTVVLLIATKGTLHVAHIGDSRAYLRHNGVLTQITMDHPMCRILSISGRSPRKRPDSTLSGISLPGVGCP